MTMCGSFRSKVTDRRMRSHPYCALHFISAMLFDATLSMSPSAHAQASVCPQKMVLISGHYCPKVRQDCLEWLERPRGNDGRCRRFAAAKCLAPRFPMRFCIDVDEASSRANGLPMAHVSWRNAATFCKASGRRLCLESEWTFACEGDEMLPYPTGLVRDSSQCNFDQANIVDKHGKPLDLRKPPAEACKSPFGVRNLVGNIDEWTVRDVTWGPFRSALKGGWWLAGRNRCRPATTAHGENYRDFQTGFRCCKSID